MHSRRTESKAIEARRTDHAATRAPRGRTWLRRGIVLACLWTLLGWMAVAAPPKPGDPAPDFELRDLEGKAVRLSDLRGKPVVLHFWATWCPHCLTEMPMLEKAGQDLAAHGVRVLAVNLGEPRRKIESYVRDQKLHLKVLLDSRGKAAQAFGVVGLPATVVITPAGAIAGQIDMGSLSAPALQALLEARGHSDR